MGLRRRGTGTESVVELDEDVYVVSPKAAEQAVKAQKETRRAARAERKLAETVARDERRAVTSGRTPDVGGTELAVDATKKKRDKKNAAPEPVTGATVKRYIGIAKIVVPVVAPLVYQAVGTARSYWDTRRARELGVPPEQLADFTGRGAALYARIHNLALSVRDLRTRRGEDHDARTFADDADNRLADLEAAVRSAEQMPGSRRRSAHLAIAGELDRIETRLLAYWGVDGSPTPGGSLPTGRA